MVQRRKAARVGVADGGDVGGAVGVEEDGDSEGDFRRSAASIFDALVVVGVGVGVVVLRVDLMTRTRRIG